MTATSQREIERFTEAGLWGNDPKTHSLDGLLRRHAEENPDEVVLYDDPAKAEWGTGSPRSLSWRDWNTDVEILAGFLAGLNLSEGSVIAIYGANTVETYTALLAISRAGFIAAPVPTFWRDYDMRDYLTAVQARAIIACDEVEGDEMALRCRSLAQDLFNIRYVFGFGTNLPDGVMNLARIMEMAGVDTSVDGGFDMVDPNQAIILLPPGLRHHNDEPAVERTSNHWIAAYQATFDEDFRSDVALCTFAPSGMVGVLFALVGTLLSGRRLHLHHFTSLERLEDHAVSVSADFLLLPAQLPTLDARVTASLGLVHKNSHLKPHSLTTGTEASQKILDITILNEIVAIAETRESNAAQPAGVKIDTSKDDGNAVLKFGLKAGDIQEKLGTHIKIRGGELTVSGAAVPLGYFSSDGENRADQQWPIRVSGNLSGEDGDRLEPLGFSGDVITTTGFAIYGERWMVFFSLSPALLMPLISIIPMISGCRSRLLKKAPAPTTWLSSTLPWMHLALLIFSSRDIC